MHAVLRKQEDLNPLTIYHYACSIEETLVASEVCESSISNSFHFSQITT